MPKVHFAHTTCQPPAKTDNDLSIHARTSARNNVPFVDKASKLLHFGGDTMTIQG